MLGRAVIRRGIGIAARTAEGAGGKGEAATGMSRVVEGSGKEGYSAPVVRNNRLTCVRKIHIIGILRLQTTLIRVWTDGFCIRS
jgi:hypothetical protein